jgi:hypothetical protein
MMCEGWKGKILHAMKPRSATLTSDGARRNHFMVELNALRTGPVELSDDELDLVTGGANQSGLVNVAVERSLNDVNIGVAAQALTANSSQTFRQL